MAKRYRVRPREHNAKKHDPHEVFDTHTKKVVFAGASWSEAARAAAALESDNWYYDNGKWKQKPPV